MNEYKVYKLIDYLRNFKINIAYIKTNIKIKLFLLIKSEK